MDDPRAAQSQRQKNGVKNRRAAAAARRRAPFTTI
jgi:hypothetical protein